MKTETLVASVVVLCSRMIRETRFKAATWVMNKSTQKMVSVLNLMEKYPSEKWTAHRILLALLAGLMYHNLAVVIVGKKSE